MNNQETLNQAQIIQSLKAPDVIRNDYVRQQFINVYNAIWKEGGEGAYERAEVHLAAGYSFASPTFICSNSLVNVCFFGILFLFLMFNV